MDPRSFDSLTRSLASAKTRRSFLGGLAALVVGARATGQASAQNGCLIPGQTRNRRGECNCPAGTDPCPDGCFDKKRDRDNCGACGFSCGDGQVCQAGRCVCPPGVECCPPGLSRCAGTCVDLTTDLENCGACGAACNPTTECAIASCQNGIACTYVFTTDPCTTEGGAAGTCSEGVCVPITTTTSTTSTSTTSTTTTSTTSTSTTSTTTTTTAPPTECTGLSNYALCNGGTNFCCGGICCTGEGVISCQQGTTCSGSSIPGGEPCAPFGNACACGTCDLASGLCPNCV